MKRALITGVTGQDGSYLAELLRKNGYVVSGINRAGGGSVEGVDLIGGDILSQEFVRELVSRKFDEIYNLASIATVESPWEDPVGAIASTGLTPLYFLEAIRMFSPGTRFFQASSAEMFGDPTTSPQNETTPFHPKNLYGLGKLLAHLAVEQYREQRNLFAVSGILFNHESPRRGEKFVTRKITSTLARIAHGADDVLSLGNLDAKRDWSFAGDVVQGMRLSMRHTVPGTYVFASNEVHTVREFVEETAHVLGMTLHWQGSGIDEKAWDMKGKIVVEINPDFYRPPEKAIRRGDITHAIRTLEWKPETSFKSLVEMMAIYDAKLTSA